MTTAPAQLETRDVAVALFARLEQAWNAADGQAFGQPFTDPTDFVDIRGTHHHTGAAGIGAGHQALFDTIYRGSTVRYDVTHVASLMPGCLLAHAAAEMTAGPMTGARSTVSAVLVEDDGRWAIRSFHNTLVAPDGPPA